MSSDDESTTIRNKAHGHRLVKSVPPGLRAATTSEYDSAVREVASKEYAHGSREDVIKKYEGMGIHLVRKTFSTKVAKFREGKDHLRKPGGKRKLEQDTTTDLVMPARISPVLENLPAVPQQLQYMPDVDDEEWAFAEGRLQLKKQNTTDSERRLLRNYYAIFKEIRSEYLRVRGPPSTSTAAAAAPSSMIPTTQQSMVMPPHQPHQPTSAYLPIPHLQGDVTASLQLLAIVAGNMKTACDNAQTAREAEASLHFMINSYMLKKNDFNDFNRENELKSLTLCIQQQLEIIELVKENTDELARHSEYNLQFIVNAVNGRSPDYPLAMENVAKTRAAAIEVGQCLRNIIGYIQNADSALLSYLKRPVFLFRKD